VAVVVSVSESIHEPLGPTRRRGLFAAAMDSGNLLGGVDPPPAMTAPGWQRAGAWSVGEWLDGERVDERAFAWHHRLDPATGLQGSRGLRGSSDVSAGLQLLTPSRPVQHGADTVVEFEYLVREPDADRRSVREVLFAHTNLGLPGPLPGPVVHSVETTVDLTAPPDQPAAAAAPAWRPRRLELAVPEPGVFVAAALSFDADLGEYLIDGLALSQRHRQMAIAWLPRLTQS
jgi:hypothetical protein